jgi:hypothetical protein
MALTPNHDRRKSSVVNIRSSMVGRQSVVLEKSWAGLADVS